ncbi:helix-turn-helix domain-containing protein [Paenibacillus humicus]|uniref:helix-turn-helix domain-containing protein n=1 Tax=Paenibacillus humicus TaxID=412861 RepID=UPI003D2BDF6E
MMDVQKNKHIMDKIDGHLRKTARRMVQFDTLDETLHYLIDSFHQQYACDYMSIIYLENDMLRLKANKGDAARFEADFPLNAKRCHPRLLLEPISSLFDVLDNKEQCPILTGLEEERFQTWFTIPIRLEEDSSLGFCVIGFRSFVPLVIGAEKLFEEYGKDIATSLQLAQQRENENKKIEGLAWLKENNYLGGSSIEQIVENIVERAGKGTNAKEAFVYLYDEHTNNLLLQPPSYGGTKPPRKIDMLDVYDLKPFFPYLEKSGASEMTIPLMVNLKLIGVLHVNEKLQGYFTNEDLELLQFLASHVSTLIENARLYMSEVDRQNRLQTYMQHQQELVKQTIDDEGFAGISNFLSDMINCSVVMLDRFLHLTSHKFKEHDEMRMEDVLDLIGREKKAILKAGQVEQWFTADGHLELGLWRVASGSDTLGYLGLLIPKSHMDIVLRMSLNHALNVCAVQFIKQKLVLDVREQVRDSFFNQLFVEKIQDRKKILEYTNLLNWNINEPHCIGLFSFEFDFKSNEEHNTNLLEEDAKKTWVWERIRDYMTRMYPGIIFTRKDGYYMVIVPKEIFAANEFWKRFYERVKKMVSSEEQHLSIHIGISQEANQIEDYYLCYKQAQKTLVILYSRFAEKGYMRFDELGSYTVLYHLGDPMVVPLFLKTYLNPLLEYGNGKNRDLFDTLRVYLQTNGNIKDAANLLFIHRSSLKYRLERIREIVGINIDHAEQRFNLMLAYKLYDLFNEES